MIENEKSWHLGDDNIYRLKYPKELTLDNIANLTSELIQDYIEKKSKIGYFLVLVDGSQVEKYDSNTILIAITKVQEWMNGRVAVYNMSPYYKKTTEDYYKTHNKLPNIEYFDSEQDGKKWLVEETKKIDLNLE